MIDLIIVGLMEHLKTVSPHIYYIKKDMEYYNVPVALYSRVLLDVEDSDILYSGKLSRDSIFTAGRSLLFRGFNFRGFTHSRPLCTVQSNLFHMFNFRG